MLPRYGASTSVSQVAASALTEDVPGIILHHAHHVEVQLANHVDAALGVQHRQVLGGADHHEPVHGQGLHHRQRRVRGAGRQVDHQVVQFVPLGVLEELVDGVVNHRAAPDDGLFLVLLEVCHGHHLDAPLLGGNYLPVHIIGPGGGGQDVGDVGTVNINVQNADPGAFLGQRDCQVDRYGGLADAALAAVYADLGLDFAQPLADLSLLLPTALYLFQAGGLGILLGGGHKLSRP